MNFSHRRGLELVELAATPERPKRFFAGEVGGNRVEGKMGLCARAQLYGLHDWTRARCGVSAPGRSRGACAEDGAQTSRIAPGVRGTRLATHRRLARSMACPRLGRRGGGAEKGLSGRTGSNGRGVARSQGASLAVREISYIKGNLRSGLSFYFKSGLSGLV
jgi:hypothetical protein